MAEVEFRAVRFGRLGADVGLFKIVGRILVSRTVDEHVGAAKDDIDVNADRIGIVIDRELEQRSG